MNLLNFIKNSLYETKEYSDLHNIYEDGANDGDEINFSNFSTNDVDQLYEYIKNGKTADAPEIQAIVDKLLGNGKNNEIMKAAGKQAFDEIYDACKKKVEGDTEFNNAQEAVDNVAKDICKPYIEKLKNEPKLPEGLTNDDVKAYFNTETGEPVSGVDIPKDPKKPAPEASEEEQKQYNEAKKKYDNYIAAKNYINNQVKQYNKAKSDLKKALGETAFNQIEDKLNNLDGEIDWKDISKNVPDDNSKKAQALQNLNKATIEKTHFQEGFVQNAVTKANNDLQNAATRANFAIKNKNSENNIVDQYNTLETKCNTEKANYDENKFNEVDFKTRVASELGIDANDLTRERYEKYCKNKKRAIDNHLSNIANAISTNPKTAKVPEADQFFKETQAIAINDTTAEIRKEEDINAEVEIAQQAANLPNDSGAKALKAASDLINDNDNFTNTAAEQLGLKKGDNDDYSDEDKKAIEDWKHEYKKGVNAALLRGDGGKNFKKDTLYNTVNTNAKKTIQDRKALERTAQLANLRGEIPNASFDDIQTTINDLKKEKDKDTIDDTDVQSMIEAGIIEPNTEKENVTEEDIAAYNAVRKKTADKIADSAYNAAKGKKDYTLPQGKDLNSLYSDSFGEYQSERITAGNNTTVKPLDKATQEKYERWAKGDFPKNNDETYKDAEINEYIKNNTIGGKKPTPANIAAFCAGLQKHATTTADALGDKTHRKKLPELNVQELSAVANTTASNPSPAQKAILKNDIINKIITKHGDANREDVVSLVNGFDDAQLSAVSSDLNNDDSDAAKYIKTQLDNKKKKGEFDNDTLDMKQKAEEEERKLKERRKDEIKKLQNKPDDELAKDFKNYCINNGIDYKDCLDDNGNISTSKLDNFEKYNEWKKKRNESISKLISNDNEMLSDYDFTIGTGKLSDEQKNNIKNAKEQREENETRIDNIIKSKRENFVKTLLGDDYNSESSLEDNIKNLSEDKKTRLEKFDKKVASWKETSMIKLNAGKKPEEALGTDDLTSELTDSEIGFANWEKGLSAAEEFAKEAKNDKLNDFDETTERIIKGLIPKNDARFENAKITKNAETNEYQIEGVDNDIAKNALQDRINKAIETRKRDRKNLENVLNKNNGDDKGFKVTNIDDKYFSSLKLDIPSLNDTNKIEAQKAEETISKKIKDSYSDENRDKAFEKFLKDNDIDKNDENIEKYKTSFEIEWDKNKSNALNDIKKAKLADNIIIDKDNILSANGKDKNTLKREADANDYKDKKIETLNNWIDTFKNSLKSNGVSDDKIEEYAKKYKEDAIKQINKNVNTIKNGERPTEIPNAESWYHDQTGEQLKDVKKRAEEQGTKIDVIDKEQIPDYWNKLSSSIDRIHKNAIDKYKNSSEYQDADPSVQSALLQKFEARLAKTKGDFESRTAKGEKIPMAEIMNINTLTCDDEDVHKTIDKMSDRAKEKQKKLTDLRHEKEAADDKVKETRRKTTDEIFNILGKVPILGVASGIIKNIVDVSRKLSDVYTAQKRADMDKDDVEEVLNKNMTALQILPIDDTMEDFKDLLSAESPEELVQAVEDNKDIQKTIGEQSKSVDFKGVTDAIEHTDTEKLENAKKEIANLEQESTNIGKNIKDTENQISHIKKSITTQERENERMRLLDKWVEEHPNDNSSDELDRLLNLSDEELDDSINNKDKEDTSNEDDENKDDENDDDNEETENEPEEDSETKEKTEDFETEENGKTVKYTFHSRPSKRDENETVYTYDRQVDGEFTAKGASITKKEIAEIKSRMKKNNENDDEETENEPEETKESVLVRYIAKIINENAKNDNINLKNYIRQNILF